MKLPINYDTSPFHGAGSREHLFVRAGRIRAALVAEEVVLSGGDYATYAADWAHRWEVIDADTSVRIAHTLLPWAAYVA